jgi:hypothetical protein
MELVTRSLQGLQRLIEALQKDKISNKLTNKLHLETSNLPECGSGSTHLFHQRRLALEHSQHLRRSKHMIEG